MSGYNISFTGHDKMKIIKIIIILNLLFYCYIMTKHLTTTHDFFY